MATFRQYYATQSVEINGPSGGDYTGNEAWDIVQGVQSVGITSNNNLEPVFQLGQLGTYEMFADIFDVEYTVNKVLDGRPTLYMMCMGQGSLNQLEDNKCGIRVNYFDDTAGPGSGSNITYETVPAYLQNVTYTFNTEGFSTEEVTVVGNSQATYTNATTQAHGTATTGIPGVVDRTLITEIGFTPSSIDQTIQTVSISMDLGRENIFAFGKKLPKHRYISYPVEVNVEVTSLETSTTPADVSNPTDTLVSQGGSFDSDSYCTDQRPAGGSTFYVSTCDGMRIVIGGLRFQTGSTTGGDAGGDNITSTNSYQAYSSFTYTAPSIISETDVIEGGFPAT